MSLVIDSTSDFEPPIIDPMLPARDRRKLAENWGALTPACREVPESRWGMASGLVFYLLVVWGLSVLGGMFASELPAGIWAIGGFIAVADRVSKHKIKSLAREHRGHYLHGADFDVIARTALARARSAIDQVQKSTVNREGLLDIDNAVVLPEQLWQFAVSLHA